MNRDQRERLGQIQGIEPMIGYQDVFVPGVPTLGDRTLVLGFSKDPVVTWHIYVKDGLIHRLLYAAIWDRDAGGNNVYVREGVVEYDAGFTFDCQLLVPHKRAYSESSDYLFARLMIERGHPLCFTTHDDEAHARRKAGIQGRTTPSIYAGAIKEELS